MAERASTPPKTEGASNGAIAATTSPSKTGYGSSTATQAQSTGVQSALQSVDQLEATVHQLRNELQTYAEPNVIGRNTILLRSFFDQAVGRLMQISQACKVTWTPPQAASFRGR